MFKGRVQKDIVENSTKGGGLKHWILHIWPHCSGAEKIKFVQGQGCIVLKIKGFFLGGGGGGRRE